ncbi:D-inositol-3-phosphate glycosyltransferase [Ornithinimicrobium panacihumi]|uniref:D-inositol-3-phosphate glycosyltransferase n=1 Tax=Ornithinimicrobium panacihumi TaxID=2008449 RepID=UPI003F8C0EF0
MTAAAPLPSRVAMVSLHTSPLAVPGTGDAGGLNVYVAETAARLAARGVHVDVFTRATEGEGMQQLAPGAHVHHLPAGPAGLDKGQLPGHVAQFADAMVGHARAAGGYDVVHSHYWLSGVAGLGLVRATGGALVHTMHTMARVKNAALAPGERPEPPVREAGEEQIVREAAALVANTADEARSLVDLYGADPGRVHVVHPGVALEIFHPDAAAGTRDEAQARAREAVGLPRDAVVLLFVGRIQPLKAPDVLVRAAGELVRREPSLRRRLVVAVLGGLSGSGLAAPDALQRVVVEERLEDVVRYDTSMPREELARWYRAADLLAVPSHNESFGLVAVEALACGTPVVAARVGGLPTAVGEAGVLVDGHDPADWADAIAATLARLGEPGARQDWSARAAAHARGFSWERTVDRLVAVYGGASGAPDAHGARPDPRER